MQLTEQLATLMANQTLFQGLNPNSSGDGEFEESGEEESNHLLFFDDDYVSEEVLVDFDLSPVFDEDIFEVRVCE